MVQTSYAYRCRVCKQDVGNYLSAIAHHENYHGDKSFDDVIVTIKVMMV